MTTCSSGISKGHALVGPEPRVQLDETLAEVVDYFQTRSLGATLGRNPRVGCVTLGAHLRPIATKHRASGFGLPAGFRRADRSRIDAYRRQ